MRHPRDRNRFVEPILHNMIARLPLLVGLWLLRMGAFAQPTYQILLNIPSGDATRILAVVPSAEGAAIVVFDDGSDSYVFRKFNSGGAHEWSKRIQSPALRNPWSGSGTGVPSTEWYGLYHPFQPDGDGGLIYCYPTLPVWSTDGNGMDTSATSTTIMRMDADGNVVRFDELHHELILPADSLASLVGTQHASVALFPDGGMLVLEAYHSSWSQVIMSQMTRLDPDGNIVWAKWYHNPGQPITQGPIGDMGQLCWFVTDTEGGTYMVDGLYARVLHFDGQGNCNWVKSYTYDGNAFARSPGLLVDAVTNDLIIADDVETFTWRKQTIIRISPGGDLLDVRVFSYPPGNPLVSSAEVVSLWPDGSTVIGENNPTDLREEFTIIDPSGTTAKHFAPWLGADPDNGFIQYWETFAPAEAHLLAAGTSSVVDNDLGSVTEYPMLASFTEAEMGGCLSTMSMSSAIQGLSVCTVVMQESWLDVAAGQLNTVLPLPAPFISDIDPPEVIDFCSYNVGLREEDLSKAFMIAPTLMQEGDNPQVISAISGLIEVIAMDGRLMRSWPVSIGLSSMSVSGLLPGAYAVMLTSQDRTVRLSRRIVVL